MPRLSMQAATLLEKRRADGSAYLIGRWRGLRVFIEERGDEWVMHLSEAYPNEARNLAGHFEARADGLTRRQLEQAARGSADHADRLAAQARFNGKIAETLREERDSDDTIEA